MNKGIVRALVGSLVLVGATAWGLDSRADLPPTKRESMTAYETPTFDTRPWVTGAPLAERTVALISTAGLVLRGERPMTPRDKRYRVIPDAVDENGILMSHVSVNFDRTGFQRDLDVVLPRTRLRELADHGEIGAVADRHYSFMGATEAKQFERSARNLAGVLRDEGVDTALLLPV